MVGFGDSHRTTGVRLPKGGGSRHYGVRLAGCRLLSPTGVRMVRGDSHRKGLRDGFARKRDVWLDVETTGEGVGLAVGQPGIAGLGRWVWLSKQPGWDAFGLVENSRSVLGGDTGIGSIYSLNHCPGVLGGDTCDGYIQVYVTAS
ncbi:hypothetical protein Tco_1556628 [Tanacetum coccineum]